LETPVEPRQPRALRTRARLLEAVEVLVAAEGPEAVTTTRVAAETGVSVGTIYRYFEDREALLLAAYDATVARIVEQCAAVLHELPADMPAAEAARILLFSYLEAAEAIPAHAGLLAAMRAIRPIEADQGGSNEVSIIGDLLAPFLAKFAPGAAADRSRLHFLNVLIGTMVDLYLVTPEPAERRRLRTEIDAHMQLALERTLKPGDAVKQ
jgi:AcrR family transcriptional regulator